MFCVSGPSPHGTETHYLLYCHFKKCRVVVVVVVVVVGQEDFILYFIF